MSTRWAEITPEELIVDEVIGKGAFGVVSKARWNGQVVAIKVIETEQAKKEFQKELNQLARVDHPNIVKLHGAYTKNHSYLVMEYAEGGSLYNVLHGTPPLFPYTAAHAVSWCSQAADGVAYLHDMKPKALIHRDLKPPNLLLVQQGRVLKICDFGTACENHTYMTNAKGSAAWMAPEVFEGQHYNESCDVFSWGIILWEVLTRRKPFEHAGAAFRIMWMVHEGKRPPLISNCPKPLDDLMQACWHQQPNRRPPMSEVVRIMKIMKKVYSAETIPPLRYLENEKDPAYSSVFDSPPDTESARASLSASVVLKTRAQRLEEMYGEAEQLNATPATQRQAEPARALEAVGKSAPASIASGLHLLTQTPTGRPSSQHALGKALRHRRAGSEDTAAILSQMGSSQNAVSNTLSPTPPARRHRRTGSHGSNFMQRLQTQQESSAQLPQPKSDDSPEQPTQQIPADPRDATKQGPEVFDRMTNAAMDLSMQPLAPNRSSEESMRLYNETEQARQQYMRMKMELQVLQKRKLELQEDLARRRDEDYRASCHMSQQYSEIIQENDQLRQLRDNLKQQLSSYQATAQAS